MLIGTSSLSRLLILAFFYLLTLGIFITKGTNKIIIKNNNKILNRTVKRDAFLCSVDFPDEIQPVAEAAASSRLLDLPVTDEAAANSVSNEDTDLLLASSSDAALFDHLLPCIDELTENGKDCTTDSDDISVNRLSVSDAGAPTTVNDIEQNEFAARTNHLVSDSADDDDLLSRMEDALTSYIGSSSEAV